MIGRPEGELLCAYCAGELRHPADAAQRAVQNQNVPRFTMLKGYYNRELREGERY